MSLKLDNACVSLPDMRGVKNHILGYWNGMSLCSPMFLCHSGSPDSGYIATVYLIQYLSLHSLFSTEKDIKHTELSANKI